MKHNHWTIIAYEKQRVDRINGNIMLDGSVEVAIDALTEEEALVKAKETIDRPFYRVGKVFRCEQDHEIDTDLKILQLKMMKGHLK